MRNAQSVFSEIKLAREPWFGLSASQNCLNASTVGWERTCERFKDLAAADLLQHDLQKTDHLRLLTDDA